MSSPSTAQTATAADQGLARGRLGVIDIVFLVVSAAAPLTVVVSAAPSAFHFGGIGGPGAMMFGGLVLLLFAAGFTAMTGYVRNAGAFYAYAARGVNKPYGLGVAAVTIFSYIVLTLSFYAYIGFFGNLLFQDFFGLFSADIPWWVFSLTVLAAVAFLGRRSVEVGARTLGVLLTAEVAILVILAVVVLVKGGPEAPSAAPFNPQNFLLTSAAAPLLVLAFGAYVGFEGTAIYSEEAKEPRRTIPRATYIAVSMLALLYGFMFWILTYAFGINGIQEVAQSEDWPFLTLIAGGNYLGSWASYIMEVLIITSFFACLLAFHNGASRYLFAFGREGLLPRRLGHVTSTGAPATASLTMSIISFVAIVIAIALQADPFTQFGLWTYLGRGRHHLQPGRDRHRGGRVLPAGPAWRERLPGHRGPRARSSGAGSRVHPHRAQLRGHLRARADREPAPVVPDAHPVRRRHHRGLLDEVEPSGEVREPRRRRF